MPKTQLKRTFLRVILLGLVLCAGLITYATIHKPQGSGSPAPVIPIAIPHAQPTDTRKTVNAGLPTRLKIPDIDVDAALEQVNLTPKGDLGAPKDPANAGWYSQGPRPGDSGNAIIDGHFGYKDRIPAVFDNLHVLEPGDVIYVEDDHGVTTAFAVRTTQTFSPNESATAVFRPNDGKEHLNLITCQGAWSESQKSYATRLVVFADKQDSKVISQ